MLKLVINIELWSRVSLENSCNKSKVLAGVQRQTCVCVQWEGDQRRSREHPEDAARGGTAPAGPGPQDGWMEGLC